MRHVDSERAYLAQCKALSRPRQIRRVEQDTIDAIGLLAVAATIIGWILL